MDIKPDYIIRTPPYKDMINTQIISLIQTGFLPKPPSLKFKEKEI